MSKIKMCNIRIFKRNHFIILASMMMTLFFTQCSIAPEDEVLYMKTNNSYFPIYVRGNPNADNYIIWVHGGPGSSGLYYGDIPEVGVLQKTYRVIYWDQLSSGGTVGNPSKDDFTISNFATHVQGIVNIVSNHYKPKNLFLLGHSWGGFLSAYYLVADGNEQLSKKRQSQFKGFINLNAVLDVQDTLTNGVTFVTNYANNQISQGNKKKYWQKMINWYKEKNGVFKGKDVTEHYENVDAAGGMVIQKERRDEVEAELTLKMVFDSPFEFYSYFDNQKNIRTYLNIENCSLVRENEPNVKAITIPTLIMAGKQDKIAFLEDTKEWHRILLQNKVGAPPKDPNDFPLKEYDNAAHAVFLDAKDAYIRDIHQFINAHD